MIRSASRSATSAVAVRRTGASCSPVSSVSGGSHRANSGLAAGGGVVVDRDDRQPGEPAGRRGRIGHRRRREHEGRRTPRSARRPAAAAAARLRRASRRRRDSGGTRRRRRSAGRAGSRPTVGGRAGSSGAACRGWSARTTSGGAPSPATRPGCRRRTSPPARSPMPSAFSGAQLVGGERLGRREVERGRPVGAERPRGRQVAVLEHGAQRRDEVAERLARRGPGGHDDRLPGPAPARRPRPGAPTGRALPRAASDAISSGCTQSGHCAPPAGPGGDALDVGEPLPATGSLQQAGQPRAGQPLDLVERRIAMRLAAGSVRTSRGSSGTCAVCHRHEPLGEGG